MNLPFVASWKRFGDSVFIYSNCDSTFHGSAKSCAEFYGATLASVHSVEEMQVIFNLTQDHNDPAWLGGYKPGKKWRWLEEIRHYRKVSMGPFPEPEINCFRYLFFDTSMFFKGPVHWMVPE